MKLVNSKKWLMLLAMLGVFSLQAETPRDPHQYFFHETFGDYSEELENAKQQNKKAIMVFFEMDECPFCHRMKKMVMSQPKVQNYFRERFLIFTHDIEGDLDIIDFAGNETTQKVYATQEHRIRATPVMAFFDLQGKRIFRYIGTTRTAEEFMWLADFIVEGHYQNTSFTRYKRARKQSAKS